MNEIKINRCLDLNHELEKASILFKSKDLCLKVLDVHISVDKGDENKQELSAESARAFFESGQYEREQFTISQAFDIVITKREENLPQFKLELLEQCSELWLVCQSEHYEDLCLHASRVYDEINAQKALLGVIFDDFDDSQDFAEVLKDAQEGLGGCKRICLKKSKVYSNLIDMHFIFTLKEEWEFKNNQSLENSSYATKEGGEIGKMHKGRIGRDGRNLLGEFVRVEKREPHFVELGYLGEDFAVEEREDCFVYFASKNGFVGLNGSGLILIKDFSLEEINYRNMGNLLGGIECGFELNIKSPAVDKDAIGSGIVIEAERISVSGSIDQGVILRAGECNIQGAIHQSAEIYARRVEISTHKGYIKADEVRAKICEGGKIECRVAEIEDFVGGELACQEAVIDTLRANNTICFSSQIEIRNVFKGGNHFKIDCSAFYIDKERIDAIKKKYYKYLAFIDRVTRIYQQESSKIKQSSSAIKQFQAIFMQNMSQGLQTQSYILNAIQQYVQMCEKLKQVKEKIYVWKERAQEIREELLPIAQVSFKARILCHSPWVDQNQVEYFDLMADTRESLLIEDGECVNIVVDSEHKLLKERF